MEKRIVSISDALPYREFARVIGKSEAAVRGMIEKNPELREGRTGEYWVYLPAWNAGMKQAYESRPAEIRNGWLQWLGLAG